MIKIIHFLIDTYLKKFHNYNISMDLSTNKTVLIIYFTSFFLFKNIYCKRKIDCIVENRLSKYYMDDISHLKSVYYVNRLTGRVDRFRPAFL